MTGITADDSRRAIRRGDRAAEGARLESVLSRKRHVGSNPTLSAIGRQV